MDSDVGCSCAVMLCRCNECWDNMNADFCESDIRSSNSAPGSGDGGLGGADKDFAKKPGKLRKETDEK